MNFTGGVKEGLYFSGEVTAVDKVWGTTPDQVWGASLSGGDPRHVPAETPPSSPWAFKTSTPSVHSADSEDTLLDVKEETSSSSGVGIRRKRRKSKSPKFTVGISLYELPKIYLCCRW